MHTTSVPHEPDSLTSSFTSDSNSANDHTNQTLLYIMQIYLWQ